MPVDILQGLSDEMALEMARNLEFKNSMVAVAAEQIRCLYNLFLSVDATQVEINPFGETPDGRGNHAYRISVFYNCPVVCFDAKINFDDNAKYRQKEIFDQEDTAENDPRDVMAAKLGLNYIGMDGNIGCLGTLLPVTLHHNSFYSKRSWACHGNDGHHQAAQRTACQFSRRRGRSYRETGTGSL